MTNWGMVDDICELAERTGERPPAPSWHRGAYPAIGGCNADGDPARSFERAFETGFRGCYVDVCCEDVLTARGARRSPTLVHVDGPNQGATPAQARALAAALLQAADVAETN
jgi:hypothetical protein